MNELTIWLLQSGEPLPIESGVRKMRTALLADKLLERGFNVHWWGSAFEHQRKKWISDKDRDFHIAPNFTIRALHGCGYSKNISFARYIDHRIVALKFRAQSKKIRKPDIIVASMPCYHLAYESMRYARRNSIPLVVDIRDLWPDIFLDPLRKMRLDVLGRIVLSLDFAKLTLLLRKADALVAMSKGCLEWGLRKAGRSVGEWDNVFYHGYKAHSKKAAGPNEGSEIPAWLKGRENQKLFIFIGTFGVSYELELVLEAARRFSKSGRDGICFVIAGTGEKFDLICKKASGLKNVVLPGWIEGKEINVLLRSAFVGLVPCRSVKNAMPNKPFEYLSAGLPLISSLEGEMAELIDQQVLGFNYLPGDLEGLCACIDRLASDSSLHDDMSRNALDFFEKHGDADKIYGEYAWYIERVGRRGLTQRRKDAKVKKKL